MKPVIDTDIVTPAAVAPAVTGLVSYFGSNRTLAANVGRELAGRNHVTVPFAGSLTEGLAMRARSLVVGDVHRHLMNLFAVAADPRLGPALYRRLRRLPFHPDVMATAQDRCLAREISPAGLFGGGTPAAAPTDDERLVWAADYFVTSWFGQGARSGTPAEFRGPMSVRFDAGGGDSCRRFRSAVGSLPAWRRAVLNRCTFQTIDFRELLAKCRDRDDCGVYADPPFVDEGDGYKHPFTLGDHRDLAKRLNAFDVTRVVVRYYDNPLVRELYPADRWTYLQFDGRDQHNATGKPELLIVNGPSLAGGPALTRVQRSLLCQIASRGWVAVGESEPRIWTHLRHDVKGTSGPVADADVRALVAAGHLQIDVAKGVAFASAAGVAAVRIGGAA